MIVKTIDEILDSDREVTAPNGNWVSRRLLLDNDGMGFSFHETIIKAGTETLIQYKNHLEAVYCVEGEGEIETTVDGKVYPIKPGSMYALNNHDKHYLRAFKEDLRLLCVFNPPLTGDETHDEYGSYPLPK
jgi:L-ectoine synthase